MDEFRRKPVNRAPAPASPPPATSPDTTKLNVPESAAVISAPTPSGGPDQGDFGSQPSLGNRDAGSKPVKKARKKIILWSITGLIGFILLIIGGAWLWYSIQLSPVDGSNKDKTLIEIEPGTTPDEIADQLHEEKLIRSTTAFFWYTRIHGVQNSLQAGTYRISPSESTPKIVEHLTSGKVDTFSITFLPGATLAKNREGLISAGYTAEEVDAALTKPYDSPLFAGKPATADLEGYIYGETYNFPTDSSVEAILEHIFDYYYGIVEKNDLIAKYESRGLSLYEGITLASIVQREASPKADDMPQIAQVFYSRLADGTLLGSDVTYQYIADKMGVPRDPSLDSPYNTRKYAGLPPGPISSPGEKALVAVANPASTTYFYFLSGDDDVTYFAHTLQEHEANIQNHCHEKCKIL